MTDDDQELYLDRWVRIGDDDRGLVGQITALDDVNDPYRITIKGRDGHEYVVPAGLVFPVEHPLIAKAAHELQFSLESFDPTWKQTDTSQLRAKLVRIVLRTLGINVEDLAQGR